MLKLLFFFFLICTLLSCTTDRNADDDLSLFSQVVDEMLTSKFGTDTLVVQIETRPIYKTMYGDKVAPIDRTEPPPLSIMYIDRGFMRHLKTEEIIDSLEFEYFFNRIDSTKMGKLDTEKISQPTISETELAQLFSERGKAYEKLETRYGTPCFLQFSYPVFNSDRTTVIFVVDKACGWLRGEESIFVMQLINGKWTIVHETGTLG